MHGFAHQRISPSDIRYIKLGKGGVYEEQCLAKGILRLGFHFTPHEAALANDIETMRAAALDHRGNVQTSSSDARQVADFYALSANTLWITFINGRLYWCFADETVEWINAERSDSEHAFRIRRCKTQWRHTDLLGAPLRISELNGGLTKVAAYRGSICKVDATEYLIRRINGELMPEVARAHEIRTGLLRNIESLMRLLDWRDFELLVELVFSNSGWRRTGVLGGAQKTVDLELTLPSTGERAFVQVKSNTDQTQLDDYLRQFRARDEDRMFYVYHSANSALTAPDDSCILVGPERLAEMILEAGLYDWLIKRVS
jgi:Restriction endonuclease